ncbi:hypothetical protein THERMOT_1455, partial [Bathymodiolus thermophilus thioautotrophic gill symbiont]
YNAKQPTVSEGTTATHHITITATDAAGNASNKNIVINLENPFTIEVSQAFNSRSVVTVVAQGFVMNGEKAGDQSGSSVSSAGDVNGDGLDDLIIGAFWADPTSGDKAGKSFVVFGKTNATAINLSDIASGIGGFVINGENENDWSGRAVSSAGDVNGDGFDDLIVSAHMAKSTSKFFAGKTSVVFGKGNDTTAVNLSDIASGVGGFAISGVGVGDLSGYSLSSAGDVNGDGLDDLIIGAWGADTAAGKSYVVFGKNTNTSAVDLSEVEAGTGGFVINGENDSDYSGYSVSSAGDVNGDGFDDLIVGAFGVDSADGIKAGSSYVVFGKKDNTDAVNLSSVATGIGGFVIKGESAEDYSGYSVSSAGDVNGDGLSDLIVGAYAADSGQENTGKTFVVFGKKDTNAVNLSSITAGIGGFVINGENAWDFSSYSISLAGDVNGDGLSDLIIGAYGANLNNMLNVGRTYVVFGKADNAAIDLSDITLGMGGFIIDGENSDRSGFSVSSAGDVNGDGLDDLIVGAPKANSVAGKSYVVFGKTNTAAVKLSDVSNGIGSAGHAIDFQGNQSEYIGTSADELFVAGLSNNILRGNGGADVFNAGAGDDTIIINGDNLAKLYSNKLSSHLLARVDGGGGTDTLKLEGSNLFLDLIDIDNGRIQDIEIINLGSSSNTLRLGLKDLLDISSETNVLKVIGNSGASVEVIGLEKSNTSKAVNGITYKVYFHADAPTAKLWVEQNLLVSISVAQGFVINGANTGDQSGYSVSSAGDVNGDGLDDLIVGACKADPAGGADAGKSYVVFGKNVNTTTVNLSEIVFGTGGFVINGENIYDNSGFSVSSAGDINGDGLDDLIVGSYLSDPANVMGAGKTFVVFGKNNDTAAIHLSNITSGTGGFVINGENADDQSGRSVSSVGDVNGDGLDDLIIGAHHADLNGVDRVGRSFVVFGKKNDTAAINLSNIASGVGGFVINGENANDYSGSSVSSAGDVNGDGLDDLIVSAYRASVTDSADNEGKSYVVFGRKSDTTAINLSDIVSGTGGFVINGEHALDQSGTSIASAGDVNGDGLGDLIVSAHINSNNTSKSFVVFGKKNDTTAINLSNIAFGTGGFVINGENAGDFGGYSVSSAGDVNGDGLDDLIVGAYKASPAGGNKAGKSFVVFGKRGDTTAINLSDIASGTGGFVINGENAGDFSGYSVSSAGDVNGDGLDDLIIGAYAADNKTGKSFVVFGKTNTKAVNLLDVSKSIGFIGHIIDFQGDINANKNDTLVGTAVNELFVAGLGNDTLIGNGGTDVFNAGAGNDTIVINGDNLAKLYSNKFSSHLLARVNGGGNTDTLKLEGDNLFLNLVKIDNGRIQDIEIIDLRSNSNVLRLNLNDLLDISSETNTLKVIGNSGGNVEAIGFTKLGADETVDGVTYEVYSHADAPTARLWVEQNLIVSTFVAQGFVIKGENISDISGRSVSSAGDVNGDGLDDLIVGANWADPTGGTNAGKSYVVFGKVDPTAINLSNIALGIGGFVINGEKAHDNSGYSVSSAGDVNGDGLDDVIIGAYKAQSISGNEAGKSFVVFGKKNDTTAINLSNINLGIGGYTINGDKIGDWSGYSVSSAGDVNGDGLDDVIIGAYKAGSEVGKSFVVFGKTNRSSIHLSNIAAGINGFVINGEKAGDWSGYSVSSAGDVNGDGLDDLIVGAEKSDSTVGGQVGKSFVVFGRKNDTAAVDLSNIASGTGGFVINGENAEDYSGCSVSSAGDVNGDGLDDLIVGAYQANSTAGVNVGKSYVVFGKTNTTAVNLSNIASGTGGFVINGENVYDNSGYSVSSAGDVNGDGLEDVIIGANKANALGAIDIGKSYVVFGKMNTTVVNLSDIASGTGGFIINGENTSDYSGTSVSSAGDVNGDGLDDLIVGANWADTLDNNAGKSYVIFGKTDTKAINLTEISKGKGFSSHAIDFQGNKGEYIGTPVNELFVAGSGNNILIGNGGADVFNAGAGNDIIVINGDNLDKLYSNKLSSHLLARVDGGGGTDILKLVGTNLDLDLTNIGNGRIQDIEIIDLTGSGDNTLALSLSDLLDISSETNVLKVTGNVGDKVEFKTPGFEKSNTNESMDGVIYKVYSHTGAPTAKLWVKQGLTVSFPSSQGFTINGEGADDWSGLSVSSAGDVNGDGLDDVIVGAYRATPGGYHSGKSYVVFGKTNATTVNLSDITSGTGGFVINGDKVDDHSGYSVSSIGDFNGDGLDDLIVGAYRASPTGGSKAGKTYVVLGKTDTVAVNLSEINNTGGLVINGYKTGDWSGYSVSSAGDVNGDGLADVIIGAYKADPAGSKSAGKSFVVFGTIFTNAIKLFDVNGGAEGFVINGENAWDYSGFSVSSAGDVNGDGLDDLIVGTVLTGKSYVVFGRTNDTTAVELSSIAAGTGGFIINGEGDCVSSAGDVNGDGLDDLIIGYSNARSPAGACAGRSFVVFGKKNDTTAINLSTIANGTGGFVINGGRSGDWSGHSVSSAGDVNGDGLDDLIVGAASGGTGFGKSFVVFGKTDTSAVNLSDVGFGTGGFIINGEGDGDKSGVSVSSAGDINSDGLDDLIIGALWADTASGANAGKSYVVFGKTDTKAVHLSNVSKGTGFIGHAIDFQGDTNGDKNDTLAGTSADELFVAGLGNDILTGNGGTDVFNAGAGNDTIIINNDNLAKLYSNTLSSNLLARVNGGGNTDTLKLAGANLNLDLTRIDNGRIQDIEIIDLTGSGDNILKLNLNDLLDISSETNVLKVVGDSGDKVDIELSNIAFIKDFTETKNGITYDVYSNPNAITAKLWIDQDLGVI